MSTTTGPARTISVASAKGGCGKTTFCLTLGTQLAHMGLRIAVLDSDLNQHASSFARKAQIRGFEVIPDVGETNFLETLKARRNDFDVIIVDLPGGSSVLALKSFQKSDLVIIPCQQTQPDVRDAVRTATMVHEAEDLSNVRIPTAFVWSRVSNIESKVERGVRMSLETWNQTTSERENRDPVRLLRTSILNRAGYQEMFVTGVPPYARDAVKDARTKEMKKDSVAANAEELGREVLYILGLAVRTGALA